MPLYKFHCRNCDRDFEAFLSLRELNAGAVCPSCKGKETDGPLDGRSESFQAAAPAACGLSKKS